MRRLVVVVAACHAVGVVITYVHCTSRELGGNDLTYVAATAFSGMVPGAVVSLSPGNDAINGGSCGVPGTTVPTPQGSTYCANLLPAGCRAVVEGGAGEIQLESCANFTGAGTLYLAHQTFRSVQALAFDGLHVSGDLDMSSNPFLAELRRGSLAGVTVDGNLVASNCSSLTQLGPAAFSVADSISHVNGVIDLSFNVQLQVIGNDTFTGLSVPDASSIVLSDTGLRVIGARAFADVVFTATDATVMAATLDLCGLPLETVGSEAFEGLRAGAVRLCNTSQLSTIGARAFAGVEVASVVDLGWSGINSDTGLDIAALAFQGAMVGELVLRGSGVRVLGTDAFNGVSVSGDLDMSDCASLVEIQARAFSGSEVLGSVRLSNCGSLTSIGPFAFMDISVGGVVDLSGNAVLHVLQPHAFSGLAIQDIAALILGATPLRVIEDEAFKGLAFTSPSATSAVLDLRGFGIQALGNSSFFGLDLHALDLRDNQISELPSFAFNRLRLSSPAALRLGGNPLHRVRDNGFVGAQFAEPAGSLRLDMLPLYSLGRRAFARLTLGSVNLTGSALGAVTEFAFDGLTVDQLLLRGCNNLTTVMGYGFTGLQLSGASNDGRSLDLSGLAIRAIHGMAFFGLDVDRLLLSGNRWRECVDGTFAGLTLPNPSSLHVQANPLVRLATGCTRDVKWRLMPPASVGVWNVSGTLDMRGLGVKWVEPHALSGVVARTVDLRDNAISTWHGYALYSVVTRSLLLQGNPLSTIDSYAATGLQLSPNATLNLANLNVSEVRPHAFAGLHVSSLAMDGCALGSGIASEGFSGIQVSGRLSLMSAGISAIAPDAFANSVVGSIDVRYNPLNELAGHAFRGLNVSSGDVDLRGMYNLTTVRERALARIRIDRGSLRLSNCTKLASLSPRMFEDTMIFNVLDLRANPLLHVLPTRFVDGLAVQSVANILLAGTPLRQLGPRCFSGVRVANATVDLNLRGFGLVEVGEGFADGLRPRSVDLRNNSLAILRYRVFAGISVPSASAVLLAGNPLEIVEARAFDGLAFEQPGSGVLQLDFPTLRSVGPHAFVGLDVWEVNLTGTRLATISSFTFSGLRAGAVTLKACSRLSSVQPFGFANLILTSVDAELDLRSLNLTILYTSSFSDFQVTALRLEGNHLKVIPSEFAANLTVPTISAIGLRDNPLRTLEPAAFQGIRLVRAVHVNGTTNTTRLFGWMDLSGLGIEHIGSGAFAGLQMATLSLGNNSMTQLPPFVFANLTVNSLRLQGNTDLRRIASHAFSLLSLNPAATLDLSNLGVRVIEPLAFDGLRCTDLLLSGSNLTTGIPSRAFRGLVLLGSLDLSHAGIALIESSAFQGLQAGGSVLLSRNLMTSVSAHAFSGVAIARDLAVEECAFLTAIETGAFSNAFIGGSLLLRRNPRLTSLNRMFWDGSQCNTTLLGTLDARQNENLRIIPSRAFSCLHVGTVEAVLFRGSPVQIVQAFAFDGLSLLDTNSSNAVLDLSGLGIRVIGTMAFAGLRVRVANLTHNALTSLVPRTFGNLTVSEDLLLSGNDNLSSLLAGAFQGLTLGHSATLALASMSISFIANGVFSGLNCAAVDLRHNRVSAVSSYMFDGLTVGTASGLLLRGNPITTLRSNAFTGVRFREASADNLVGILDLEAIGVVSIEPYAFAGVLARRLVLRDNAMHTLVGYVFSGATLSELDVGGLWALRVVESWAFAGVTLATSAVVDLSGVGISRIDASAFEGLKCGSVWLQHNNVTMLPSGAFHGVQLSGDIVLSGSAVNVVQSGAFLDAVVHGSLHLDGNPLAELQSGSLGNMSIGANLNLSRSSHLGVLPARFAAHTEVNGSVFVSNCSRLSNLQTNAFQGLSVFGGSVVLTLNPRIATIETRAFGGLKIVDVGRLRFDGSVVRRVNSRGFVDIHVLSPHANRQATLSLRGVHLRELGEACFDGLIAGGLDLSMNAVSHVPAGAFGMVNLSSALNLTGSGVTTFDPWAFAGLRALEMLLESNMLEVMPPFGFGNLSVPSASAIRLHGNPLKRLESDAFAQIVLEKLVNGGGVASGGELNLAGLDVETIKPFAFRGLQVARLVLADNNLTTLQARALSGLRCHDSIDLSRNSLSTVAPGAFTDVEAAVLDLSRNSLAVLASEALAGLSVPSASALVYTGNPVTTVLKRAFANITFRDVNASDTEGCVGVLDLGGLGIQSLASYSFVEVQACVVNASFNRMVSLPPSVFGGMRAAVNLEGNTALRTLESHAFSKSLIPPTEVVRLSGLGITDIRASAFYGLTVAGLELSNNKVAVLPSLAFDGLVVRGVVDLRSSQVGELTAGCFRGLTANALLLQHNDFGVLPAGAFNGLSLPSASALVLTANVVARVESLAFRGVIFRDSAAEFMMGTRESTVSFETTGGLNVDYTAMSGAPVGTLLLRGLGMEVVESWAFAGVAAAIVDVRDNLLRELQPYSFGNVTTLDIKFGGNTRLRRLSNFSFSAMRLDSRAVLELGGVGLTTIDPLAFHGVDCTSLQLAGNALSHLPSSSFAGISLSGDLNLSNSSVSSIEPHVFSGTVVGGSVLLSHNHLATFQANTFSQLAVSRDVDLSQNPLEAVEPFAGQGLTVAGFLNLSMCEQLHDIAPDAFSGATLGGLDLSSLPMLQQLGSFFLRGLRIPSVGLTVLRLESTPLQQLQANAFGGVVLTSPSARIATLDLSAVGLGVIGPNAFDGLRVGDVLLQGNQLPSLASFSMSGLQSRGVVNLRGNPLSELSFGAFLNCSAGSVDLTETQLSSVAMGVFGGLTLSVSSGSLDLSRNAHLTELRSWTQEEMTAALGVYADEPFAHTVNVAGDVRLSSCPKFASLHVNALAGLHVAGSFVADDNPAFTHLVVGALKESTFRGWSMQRNALNQIDAGVFSEAYNLEELYVDYCTAASACLRYLTL